MNSNESASRLLKARHTKEGKGQSLKEFARKLAKAGDPIAKNWFDNKKGACNKERDDKSKARISLEKAATKTSRRKSKGGGAATVTKK